MGRHKEFSRDRALAAAMKVFWREGYESTSLPQLTKAMGIGRSSLYGTFRDKESLFEEALDVYLREIGSRRFSHLYSTATAEEAFRKFFEDVVETSMNDEYPAGCLLVNSAISASALEVKVAARIRDSIDIMHSRFSDVLRRAQRSGEIQKQRDIAAMSATLVNAVFGVNVMARIKRDRKTLEGLVAGAMSIFG